MNKKTSDIPEGGELLAQQMLDLVDSSWMAQAIFVAAELHFRICWLTAR